VGGSSGCSSQHVLVVAAADAWIEAANPKTNYGSELQLFVLGGASEQRALFSFSLPAAAAGKPVVAASLVLTFAEAPNLGLGPRFLTVYPLTTAFREGQVTWNNYSNGAAHKWTTQGADFGASSAGGEAKSGDATLRLEATALVKGAYSNQQTSLDLLVRDADATQAAPVSFVFVSREGAAPGQPFLDLEYCGP